MLFMATGIDVCADPTVNVGSYITNPVAGETKFVEPTITVEDNGVVVTGQYNISYSVLASDGTTEGTESTDSRGVLIVTDATSGTYVEKYYGDVTVGKAGTVYIKVTATPKSGGDAVSTTYSLEVQSITATQKFVPVYAGALVNEHDGSLTLTTRKLENGYGGYYLSSASSMLSDYVINTTVNNVVQDITDYYDMAVAYAGSEYMSYNNGNLSYVGFGNQYTPVTNEEATAKLQELNGNTPTGTLTYTFTPKAEYEGFYPNITKVIDVRLLTSTSDEKIALHLSLSREQILQESVTSGNSGDTIHVYKYGQSDINASNNYQYYTPMPSVITADGAQLPVLVQNRGTGGWGDFKLVYEIVKDSTYYDDCRYAPFSGADPTDKSIIQPAGEATGLTINDYMYQVAKPGLVKVAVYAALDGTPNDNGYGAVLKSMYQPLTDNDGNPVTVGKYYTAYSEPIYFYIDVMKRQPMLKFDPDPNDIIFVAGDKINIPSRFNVSAYIDDSHNGEAAELHWGGNDGTDHFAYSFFISERNSDYIKLNDWPYANGQEEWEANGGDIYSYKYRHIVLENYGGIEGVANIRVGDSIKVNNTFVVVTESNIEELKLVHPKIQVGDYEQGIVYNSMKGYGNESWTMEFTQTGQYNIPYTVRPWNHVRWDNSTAIGVTFRYNAEEFLPTEIKLGYYFQIADKGQTSFDEPEAKVIVPAFRDYDVTSYYNFSYAISSDVNGTGTTVDPTTGEVTIGSNATGDVVIKVSAARNNTSVKFANPADVYYTIRIVDGAARATWEVISSCKADPCAVPDNESNRRFATIEEANGRMHFLAAGDVYGGTVFEGVPGINLTIGAPAADASEAADWTAIESDAETKKCCKHEGEKSVIVKSSKLLTLDDEGLPVSGAFYQFNPTVNGYLTVDARYYANHTVVLISKNSSSGEILKEEYKVGNTTILGDHLFEMPLLADQTYYLYDLTSGGSLNLHGYAYQPAFIFGSSTTKAESEAPLEASTFMNGLSSAVPSLYDNANTNVTFALSDYYNKGVSPSDYLEIGTEGALDPKQMTLLNGEVFKLRVTATVTSTDATLGDCVNKTTAYDVQILDIPTYSIAETLDEYGEQNIQPGTEVTTTNISTDIIMTFGGWNDSDNKYNNAGKSDSWGYKSEAGAASRIGSELEDNSPVYNKTIDGFDFFNGGANNPVDELNMLAVNNGNNMSYTYGSGTEYEQSTDFTYNTTYKLPCRGAYLKFEPRESGILIVYLVQNGSCDYQYGISSVGSSYRMKWRPLYITDETGKPVTMVNSFGNASKFLPTGEDQQNAGSFTLGISRCNKQESVIEGVWEYSDPEADKEDGCSFDWSQFYGTEEDRQHLLAAWPSKGERESIIRLNNGGFALPHKAYVRYSFEVKAGKSYFVFQTGSKFEFGGFSFVPTGYPSECKYALTSKPGALVYNSTNQEKNYAGGSVDATDLTFTWENPSNFTETLENRTITINDRRKSELTNESYADRGTLKPRTFTAGKWEGICLPFSVSTQEAKRVFGEGYALVTCDGVVEDGSEALHFVRHANTYIEAGRPYLVKPSQDGTFQFKNVTIEGAETVTKLDGETTVRVTDPSRFDINVNNGEYTFKGVYMRETMPAMSYFVKDDGLYRYSKDAKIGGYRAYFKLNDATSNAGAKAMSFYIEDLYDGEYDSEDVPTGVIVVTDEGATVSEMPADAALYNINGQKVSSNAMGINNAPNGIYIVNGRKIVK